MRYQLAEQVSLTEVDDEVVLLDLDSGAYYGLNHIGSEFLQVIVERGDAEQAIQEISVRYKIPRPKVENDINELITQLREKKLLQVSSSQ